MDTSRLGLRVRQLFAVALLGGAFAGALSIARGARLDEADFTFNNGTEVQPLDPATVTGVPEGRVIRALFEGLVVKHPETLEPVPGVAERWELTDDKATFWLREDARWSDGEPVTAHDFVFAWQQVANPANAAEIAPSTTTMPATTSAQSANGSSNASTEAYSLASRSCSISAGDRPNSLSMA